MSMTDPIADLLTRIRNANSIGRAHVRIPHSKLKQRVCDVLQREGYIKGYRQVASEPGEGIGPQGWIVVDLKYGEDDEKVIENIQRVSRPGRRVYTRAKDMRPVLNGLGIRIISTSRGVLSDREARKQNVGGEVLAEVW
ncbi:MAG: 30S ribosomal protein S8 [Planctomycetota bacterium]|nr:MAG: 30S ribosomal protein S8 [Planctomycetota bacterium]